MNCPKCKEEMAEQFFEGVNGRRIALDVCHACHGLWFDTNESRQLSPGGTLGLFRELHGRRDERRHRHLGARSMACPRCSETLALTHDLARGNRFQYSRCPANHGHFITFFQFLREKGIVRGLSTTELRELRKHVDSLLCSDCGAPIDLRKHTDCTHCQAPVSILEPACVEATVRDAQLAVGSRENVAPEVASQLLMTNLRMEGFHRRSGALAAAAIPAAAISAAAISAAALTSASSPQQEGNRLAETAELAIDSVELAVDAADVVADVDLIDMGVDIVSSALGALGDLF